MTFASPLLLLLLPLVLGGAIWAWSGRHQGRAGRRRLLSLGLRLTIFALLVLALAGPTWLRAQNAQAVAFVGDLSASTYPAQDTMAQFIDRALHQRHSGDLAALVAMGKDAVVEQPPAALSSFSRFASVVDPDYTNLEAGLNLGAAVLPSAYRRRVVLLSDGRANLGDAIGTARLLHAQGIRVDTVPLRIKSGPEVRVDGVDVPNSLHIGERFTLTLRYTSTVATTATFQIFEDGKAVASGQMPIDQGSGQRSFPLDARAAGVHTYRVVLQPAIDTLTENNEGSAIATVEGPPQVLVVEGVPGAGRQVVASLAAAHMEPVTVPGTGVNPDLATLQRYAAVVLVDVPADELGTEVMSALRSYVGDLGHGLVAIGGTNSYGLGNYGATPIEQVLPVSMDLPKRKDLPTAAVVLIVEDLESDVNVNISKRAAEGVIGLLNPDDQVAVSDANQSLVVPLQHVTDKAAIISTINAMQPADPMSYLPYLQQAYSVLRNAHAQTKHIILLGDGDAFDTYKPTLQQIATAGIQVSTIETNASAAQEFQTMADIARWGHGKYYPADNVSKIPQIFLKVARTVAHSGLIEGSFFPQEDAPSPILAGINAVPALGGYAITSPKPLATIVLASSKSDPILAQWQYGAGRAVAWTSDSQGRWTANWLANRQTSRIWASMVNWVLPAPQSSGLSLTTSQAAGSATIGVDLQNSTPYSAITARVVGPQGASTVTLQPTTPTHFEAQLPTGATGAYLVRVAAKEAGPHAPIRNISGGLVVPYPPDFRDSGLDIAALQEIAAAGGGSVLSRTADAFAENLQSVDTPTSLQWPLLLLALLLLPFDVAARRLVLTREDWRALAAALRPFRRIVPEQLEPSRQLAAIRARRRSRQPAAPAKQAATFESAPPAVPRQEPSDDAGSVSAGWPAATAVKPTPTGGHGPETASAQQFGQQAEKEAVAESTASKLLDAKRRRGR